ncbi:MAG: type II toxin-antitoxin system VapC family toxin [Chloroflexales bacterium]|nr:type II toxin-antitoxin system VapC family toxin [Chloroflexales bacterium]
MTIRAVADTHAVIWYILADKRLSATARATIDTIGADGDQVAISSLSFAEMVFLIERGRIDLTTLDQTLELLDRSNSVFVEAPIDRIVVLAMRVIDRTLVPELPDRLIAATALRHNVPVISRDRSIQASGLATIW